MAEVRIERRAHTRVSQNFLMHYRTAGSQALWDVTTTRNISAGGCLFSSNAEYISGRALEVKLKLPPVRDPVSMKGEVRRCDRAVDPDLYFIAISFSEIDEAARNDFLRTIDFFIQKETRSRT